MAFRRFILTSSGEKLSEVLKEPPDTKECEGITCSAGAPTTFTANASGDIGSMSLKSSKPRSTPRGGVQSRLSASLRAIVAGRERRKLYALRLITCERMCGPPDARTQPHKSCWLQVLFSRDALSEM